MIAGRCLIIAMLILPAPACVSPGEDSSSDGQTEGVGDATAALCQRLDGCNLLTGISVSECSDDVGACVDQIGERPQRQWHQAVDACLANEGCQDFSACYADVPYC